MPKEVLHNPALRHHNNGFPFSPAPIAIMSTAKIYQIRVNAVSEYLAEQSDPSVERFVFAYTITLENTGTVSAQLLSRHWIITDGNEEVQEVKGQGVVGQQPHLAPGEQYEYSSGSTLSTPVGTMRGFYQMVAEDGTRFEAEIPEFALTVPQALH